MASDKRVSELMKGNLHRIFGERDAHHRKAAIRELWQDFNEALFIDSGGVYRGEEEISRLCDDLLANAEGWEFIERGNIEIMPKDESAGVRVARLKWAFGPANGDPTVRGEDIATIIDGKISQMCAFIEN